MNRKNIKARNILVTLIVFVLLFTPPVALADDGQRTCSLEVSVMVERVKDENPEKDWSFVILTGSGDEKIYHGVELVTQEESNRNQDEKIHISSTERLVEGEYYTLYSTEYTGKQEVFVGLQAICNGQREIRGFNSTVFNLNCEDMFSEGVKNAVMSTLDENEFTVTATKDKGSKSNTETIWNVSTFVFYHGRHESGFQLGGLAKPLSVLLWLGWSWYVIF